MKNLLRGVRQVRKEIKRMLRGEVKCTAGTLTDDDLTESLGRDDPLILEIGCNDGSHTEWFLKLFPEAEVHCFEPDPRSLRKFRDRINSKRAAVHSLAISDHNGEIDFHVSGGLPPDASEEEYPEGWDCSGSIRQPKEVLKTHPWCTFDQTITVLTRTLDSWCEENGLADRTVDFIWADVQGAKIDLIRGARETLQRTRYFFTEYNNQELYKGQIRLNPLLRELPHFEVVTRYSDDVFLRNKMKGL
jgi:FkbM family methyltransferase